MAVFYIPIRRVILTALTRIVGSRNFVIALTLVLGASLYLWGRNELSGMFTRDETGEFVMNVAEGDPGCPPPSVYLLPGEETGVYYGAVDFYGGGIADPSVMNVGRPSVALTHAPSKMDPLAGLRADPAACRHTVMSLSGTFEAVRPLAAADAPIVNVAGSPSVALAPGADGGAVLTFTAKDGGDENQGRTAFRIEGVRDVWQYGYRRINLWNSGRSPVNVFLLGQPGYAFMSDTFEPIKVPVRNRSVAAMHLTRPGRDGGNAYQVFSRYIDYDARLQGRLIAVSTIFGIGISLMVEGLILAVLKLTRRLRPADAVDGDSDGRG